MSDDYPAGALLKVTLEIRLPVAAPEELIDKWLWHELLGLGGMPMGHPLSNESPEGFGPLALNWKWRRQTGRTQEFDVEKTETGKKYKVRYIRENV